MSRNRLVWVGILAALGVATWGAFRPQDVDDAERFKAIWAEVTRLREENAAEPSGSPRRVEL